MAMQALGSLPSGSAAVGLACGNLSEKRKALLFGRLEMHRQAQPIHTPVAAANRRAKAARRNPDVILNFRGKRKAFPFGGLEMHLQAQPIHTSVAAANRHESFDVFLSFRGPDTREKFADHLHKGLTDHRFRVFNDNRDLLGKETGPGLSRAIANSKICIPIISIKFASSAWCLCELVHMVNGCKVDPGQVVIPIFYDVEVSDVYNQTGEFGEGFSALEKDHKPELVEEWKKVLRSVVNIGGWSSRKVAGDARLVSLVVEEVSSILSPPWIEKVSSILSPLWIERIPTLGKKREKGKYEVFLISSPATKETFASHLPYYLERENISVFRDDDQYLIGKDVDCFDLSCCIVGKKREKGKYEVFPISSPATKKTFASHLPYHLERENINVFRDDDQYLIGKDVVRAMDHCKIFILIISTDFASSPNCLDKLAQMFKCVEKNGQKILPIFYGVDLWQKKELRHLFWVDILRHDVLEETRQRRLESFDRVCSIAGFVSDIGNEGELAEAVVQQVNKLMRT